MNTFIIINNKFNKKKVVFIMGAIGTGKCRLTVDLATYFRGEIINLDKMQVYKGLEIVTNKITHTKKQGTNLNFTTEDFCLKSIDYIENFLKTQFVPIIVGGSNSFIEKLVEDPVFMFKHKFQICAHLNKTILKFMMHAGLVEEVRQIFIPDVDSTKGIRRSIGVPEMAIYLREEKKYRRR
ncbi:hypothetical protein H5410_001368 [Solanum commersonii]|uniref:Uncharacterized protein n=1 Tax=Solanum commersonii TaxID=4109 RepID=A0A9J6AZG4_SOLCO|nr:hypothetical protein H5410_001368 [Solanum commersonii]